MKKYLSQDGVYYDANGKPVADALKAITEISYLKFVQKKKDLPLSSVKHSSLELSTKNGNYSFNFYSQSKNNYVKYLDSIYELDTLLRSLKDNTLKFALHFSILVCLRMPF